MGTDYASMDYSTQGCAGYGGPFGNQAIGERAAVSPLVLEATVPLRAPESREV